MRLQLGTVAQPTTTRRHGGKKQERLWHRPSQRKCDDEEETITILSDAKTGLSSFSVVQKVVVFSSPQPEDMEAKAREIVA
jgi:hypothetical protein